MNTYHKIQSVYKRDPETNYKTLLEGEFSLPEFKLLKDIDWIATEKVDGTNIRIIFDGEGFIFKGKTDRADIPSFLLKNLKKIFYPLKDDFSIIFNVANRGKEIDQTETVSPICLYGEGYGPKIQSGGKYRDDCSFVLFDVKINDIWLQRIGVEIIAEQLKIDIVPIIDEGNLIDLVDRVKEGYKSEWGDFIAEGFVMKPRVELKTRMGNRIITKIKYNDFERN